MTREPTSCAWTGALVAGMSLLIAAALAGCDASPATEREPSGGEPVPAADHRPQPGDDWEVSTPQEQGLDAERIDELYEDAAEQETLYSLLLVKDGLLVAEDYFHGGSAEEKTLVQSVSKSYLSALVGIGIREGCLPGVEQKMVEHFPERADELTDPRKREISLRQMLQMRAGYPDEETDAAYLEALYAGDYLPLLEAFPLVSDPGTDFHYSNVTYSWLAIALARACGADLREFAREQLFEPTGTEVGDWLKDADGHRIGSGGIHVTARDAATFGLLYLRDGALEGEQILPASWVRDSLQVYSEGARDYGWGFALKDLGYGYGWWSARAGDHDLRFAWGHGGQLIVLLEDLDMLIVTTADPFFGQHDGDSWKHESAIMNLVGEYVADLPAR